MTNKQLRQMLPEITTAAATRHPKAMPYDDFEADVRQAIENFQKLNANQKKRYVDYLQKVLDDSAWAKSGTGVKGKNIPFNKEDVDWPTVAEFLSDNEEEQLQAQLSEIGFTEEAQERAAILFLRAVEERLNNDPFRMALAELLESCVPSPFISDEELDVVQLLAHKIEGLESDIEYIQNENAQLVGEITQNLTEENNFIRAPRRSTINEEMLEANEDNADALFNEEQFVGDSRMREYLKSMGPDLD